MTVINGTVIINRVIGADSGNYTLTLEHSDGSVTSRDLQVIVEGTETLSSDSDLPLHPWSYFCFCSFALFC